MALGENPSVPLLASDVCWQALAILGLEMPHSSCMGIFSLWIFASSSLCMSLHAQISPFYKDTSHTGFRLSLLISVYLESSEKTLFSYKVTV